MSVTVRPSFLSFRAHGKLSAGILEAKAAALSSVVKGKDVESESSALMKQLEGASLRRALSTLGFCSQTLATETCLS